MNNFETNGLPDPAELIAERRMETIRAHRMLIVGIAPSPVAEMERKLVAALLDGTGYRFRIITAEKETLSAFLHGRETGFFPKSKQGAEQIAAFLPQKLHEMNIEMFRLGRGK